MPRIYGEALEKAKYFVKQIVSRCLGLVAFRRRTRGFL
jgi:hypothetical protein